MTRVTNTWIKKNTMQFLQSDKREALESIYNMDSIKMCSTICLKK